MEEENVPVTPCFTSEGINYMHIRISNLYSQCSPSRQSAEMTQIRLPARAWPAVTYTTSRLGLTADFYRKYSRTFSHLASVLALSKRNSNAAEIIIFLHRLASVLTEYFKELEEESIRDNFVIVYELLDEMMDFGFPQTTESKILQECAWPCLSLRVPAYMLIFTNRCSLRQVHHTRVAQARGSGSSSHGCHQRRLLEI